MINPDGIPQYDGEPSEIIAQADAMRGGADAFAATGQSVHATWQGLGGVYSAPEAGQLLTATQPVADRSGAVADEVARVAAALVTFAETMVPIKARLAQLRREARAFVAEASADEDWKDDGDKVAEHNGMLSELHALIAEWNAAERDCANAIHAAFGSDFRYVVDNGDETLAENEYGYSADTYDEAAEQNVDLPWGTVEYEDPGVLGNVLGFFQGIGESAWGDIRGLGTLIGVDGLYAMGQAWTNLGVLASTLSPAGIIYGRVNSDFGDRQEEALGALGSSMIAQDMWRENGGRATGQVLWNFGSLLAGGAGAVGKAGRLGRLGAIAERAASISVRSLFETAVRSPLSDVTARLTDAWARVQGPLDGLERTDVTIDLPEAQVRVPEQVEVPAVRDGDGSTSSGSTSSGSTSSGTDAPSPRLDEPAGPARGDGPPAGPVPDAPGAPDGAGNGAPGPGANDAPAPGGDATPDGPSGNGAEPGQPASTPDPGTPDLGGPPRQSWESDASYSDGVRGVDAQNPPIDVRDLSSRDRGELGEALTKADLLRQGYSILAEQNHVLIPGGNGRYFVPDFIARAPDGTVVAVESKFGAGARYTPGQLTGYERLAQGHPLEMRSQDLAFEFQQMEILKVDQVVTYRWNTEIVPDDALRREAAALSD